MAVAFVGLATPAIAQHCAPRAQMLGRLAKEYGETPAARGVSGAGGLVEVTVNRETGTWTILVTEPGGLACLMGAGDGWREVEESSGGRRI